MKRILLAGLLLLAPLLSAESIVVYAKGDFTALAPGASAPKPADPGRAAFLTAFENDLAQPQAFPAPLPLADFPPHGRKLAGAHGQIQLHESFTGGLVLKVALQGLLPKHRYVLTLNGNPERAGNNRLVTPVAGNEKERSFDFLTALTDPQGRYEATLGIMLPAGPYDVRFHVKDSAGFKIVLSRDFFRFTVK